MRTILLAICLCSIASSFALATDWKASHATDDDGDEVFFLSTDDTLSSVLIGTGADLHDNLKSVEVSCSAGSAMVLFELFVAPSEPAQLEYGFQNGYVSHNANLDVTKDGYWLNGEDARAFIRRTRAEEALNVKIDIAGKNGFWGLVSMRGFDWKIQQISKHCGDIDGGWLSPVWDFLD